MKLDDHIHGSNAAIGQFAFELDTDTLPVIFACSEPLCNSTLWIEGVRIVRYGFVTCIECMRPMRELYNHTVH